MSANIKQYLSAFTASQTIVDKMEIDQYPIDMFDVFNHTGKIFVSSFSDYKEWAQNNGRECPNELEEAKCYYDSYTGVCIIVYNERKPQIRIRFSLAHELAHIVLGHLTDKRTEIERGGLDNAVYYAMEGAANTFAGNFLAPPILIHELLAGKEFDVDKVAAQFNISKQSVRSYRKQDYQYWLRLPQTVCERRILNRCKERYYTFLCSQCENLFSIEYAKNCPICGSQVIHKKLEDNEIMGRKYPSVELNQQGQVKECLLCENEEYLDGTEYCMICGKPIVNRCLSAINQDSYQEYCNHAEPLPGNARYCPYCGSKTTFFESQLLPAWNAESEKSDEAQLTSWTGDDTEDDKLPF